MKQEWETLGKHGLTFFGRMSASVSHEIKNVLAVINENSGLLDDLLYMAEQGGEIEPEKLASLSKRIQSNVKRGDGIVKRMNRFAHSVDDLKGQADVFETTDLMRKMMVRLASQREVSLEVKGEQGLVVDTWPFFLQDLIFLGAEHVMERTPKNGTVTLEARSEDGQVCIDITGSGATVGNVDDLQRVWAPLLRLLACRIALQESDGKLTLIMPLKQ